jgi:hypothetical protein
MFFLAIDLKKPKMLGYFPQKFETIEFKINNYTNHLC